jgi:hypothetical protein
MTRRTPGPWIALPDGGISSSDPPQTLAVVMNGEDMTGNAALIAAAPEMLEALKGVVRVADRSTVEFDAARAAIAKAEAK